MLHRKQRGKDLLTPLEFKLLRVRVKKAKPGADATVAQCIAASAKSGSHLPRNGPPVWRSLQDLARGARLLRGI